MAKRKSRRSKGRKYGTGDALDYVPFNIDNAPRSKKTAAIFEELGFKSWRDVFADWDIVKSNTLHNFRQGHYATPNDLINDYKGLFRMGAIKILYNYNTGMYHAYVDYDGGFDDGGGGDVDFYAD